MKAKERNRLRAACRAMAAGYPELQRRQGESPEESARSIENEMAGFLGAVLKDRESVYRSAEEALQPLMLLFDVALLQVCDMSHFGFRHTGGRARIIWPGVHLPKRPRPNDVLYVLTSNLAHAMQAFRLLILHGFESQARTAFRGVVEITDLMIMVLADEATYRAYVTSFEDSKASYQHWKKHLSPSVVRASLSKFEADDRITLPIDMTATRYARATMRGYRGSFMSTMPFMWWRRIRRIRMVNGNGWRCSAMSGRFRRLRLRIRWFISGSACSGSRSCFSRSTAGASCEGIATAPGSAIAPGRSTSFSSRTCVRFGKRTCRWGLIADVVAGSGRTFVLDLLGRGTSYSPFVLVLGRAGEDGVFQRRMC